MRNRTAYLTLVAAAVCTLVGMPMAGAQAGADRSWKAPRNLFGQPDLQGVWANNNATPLQRPEALADRETITDEELAEIRARAEKLFALDTDDAVFGDSVFNLALAGADSYTSPDGNTGSYNQFWMAERDWDNRTSLVVDPPNGRVPPVTEEASTRQAATRAIRRRRAEGPEDLSAGVRCISFGVPFLGAGYNSYFQILQNEDNVIIIMEMIHDARVILLGGKPHLSEEIRQRHGDSRGTWDGDTLVIETRNFGSVDNFRGATRDLELVERLTRVGPETLEYVVTLDDSRTWTEPWTAMIPLKRSDDAIFEYACHEGNYGMEGILAAARAEETAERAAK